MIQKNKTTECASILLLAEIHEAIYAIPSKIIWGITIFIKYVLGNISNKYLVPSFCIDVKIIPIISVR